MDINELKMQIAQIVFEDVDEDYLTNLLNAATLNDISNLGLNADEQTAYTNIINSRKVEKKLENTNIKFRVNYNSINDPGNYLPVLTGGQSAPEITGIVHLPQGGERPTNVKFWYKGQVYEEGAKEPVFFPENDDMILSSQAEGVVNSSIERKDDAIGEAATPYAQEELSKAIGGE